MAGAARSRSWAATFVAQHSAASLPDVKISIPSMFSRIGATVASAPCPQSPAERASTASATATRASGTDRMCTPMEHTSARAYTARRPAREMRPYRASPCPRPGSQCRPTAILSPWATSFSLVLRSAATYCITHNALCPYPATLRQSCVAGGEGVRYGADELGHNPVSSSPTERLLLPRFGFTSHVLRGAVFPLRRADAGDHGSWLVARGSFWLRTTRG
ncbi:hypothetical protein C8R47DRAFT_749442 [Mycena vitilis]|nr:hypothetical protein C8R47DRAFT_749442 [Mycena vitilis]